MALKYCSQCGKPINDETAVCPHCGAAAAAEQVVLLNGPAKKKPALLPAGIAFAVVAVVAIFGLSIASANAIKAKANAYYEATVAEADAYYSEKITEADAYYNSKVVEPQAYLSNMSEAAYLMLEGAADAETAANLIKKVWINAIYQESDDETDPYTRPDGTFVDDFNEALDNLFADEAFLTSLYSISDNQMAVLSMMQQLNDPPEEYREAFTVLTDYYMSYKTMTDMAIDPTGSYSTYSEEFSEVDNNTVDLFNKMMIFIE